MDIVNIDALKAQGRILDAADVDPNEDYFVLGKYTNKYTTDSFKYTKYPVWAIKAGDVMGIPTLQQVLDFNHDLVDGNNFQGTGAGVGNTGTEVIAIGTNTATGNTGQSVYAIGTRSAESNTGNTVTAFGFLAAGDNTGTRVNAIGQTAAQNNTGDNVNAFGVDAANANTGDRVDALGRFAAGQNTGDRVVAIGSGAAATNAGNFVIALGVDSANGNAGNNVIALGTNAGQNNGLAKSVIISNSELPTFADYTAATDPLSVTSITVANGATPGTYLFHNQATNSIGAVRIP